MLASLSIQNVVLIAALQLEFGPNMTVLTGETGAGKSILLDALGLALGMRADAGLVRAGEDKAVVTASFDPIPASVLALLEAHDLTPLEAGEPLLIKRTLTKEGKSKAYIAGEPVTVKILQKVGHALVEMHSQHDQRGLLDSSQHRGFLDHFVPQTLQTETAQCYAVYSQAKETHAALRAKAHRMEQEQDYLSHVVAELEEMNPQPGEEDQLDTARRKFMQAEQLLSSLQEAQEALESHPRSMSQALLYAERAIGRLDEDVSEHIAPVTQALDDAHESILQAQEGIEAMQRELDINPRAQEENDARLFGLRDLARKHRTDVESLPALLEKLQTELYEAEHFDEALQAAEKAENQHKAAYVEAANQLHAARQDEALRLTNAIEQELAPLKMEKARISIDFAEQPEANWSAYGMHHITFVAATNPGAPLSPLHKTASGGELSRLMLALKVVLQEQAGKTLIFDEIDTGISGATAQAVGARLKQLSASGGQLLCITHLPQVASFGDQHWRISKSSNGEVTNTQIDVLDSQQAKQEELARLLAGDTITDAAFAAAGQLMQKAG